MWFAARAHYTHNYWLLNLAYRLLTQQEEGLTQHLHFSSKNAKFGAKKLHDGKAGIMSTRNIHC